MLANSGLHLGAWSSHKVDVTDLELANHHDEPMKPRHLYSGHPMMQKAQYLRWI